MTHIGVAANGGRQTEQARLPLWVPGDLNAFFGLGTNVMLNVIVLAGLCLYVLKLDARSIVYGSILPALGIALPIGNLWYAYLAYRLARREGRDTVAAMPYGPSVPHMFLVVFVVMLPTLLKTGSPVRAWEAGLAWAFIVGLIILAGAFVGPTIRRYTPRAAMLGTLAGISITFISMQPASRMFLVPIVALVSFAIILIGWTANVRLPFNLPAGLVAVVMGTVVGWTLILTGGASASDMQLSPLGDAFRYFGFHPPNLLNVPHLASGLAGIGPLLVTAIPLGIYNFTEGMNNVESASAAGDSYNLRAILCADGLGAIVGSALGSPFPPAVYIGHPGWKAAGGRIGYSLATGVFVAVICFLGLVQLLLAVLPIQALYPILLFIGLVIGAQAFQTTPRAHAAGVVLALIPNIANWAQGQIDNVLAAANLVAGGEGAGHVPLAAMAANGVYYEGLVKLGGGAVLAGLVLGAIAVFIIDREFLKAAVYAGAGAALALFGFIHAGSLACTGAGCDFGPTWAIAAGYLAIAAIAVGFALAVRPQPAPHAIEEEVPAAAVSVA